MPFAPAMLVLSGLVSQIESAAALCAHLGQASFPLSPDLAPAVSRVVNIQDDTLFEDLTAEEAQILHGYLRSFLHQAVDLVENPGRGSGWSFDNPAILMNIGQTSRTLVRGLAQLADTEPWLADRLAQPARFLDAGTGVGWIAIDAARHWPKLQVLGLDIFEPALALGRRNLQSSGVADRVELRRQDVTTFDEAETLALSFLAAPFMPEPVIEAALARIHAATEPGGFCAFGIFEADAAPLAQALLALRIARFGGRIWSVDEARQRLADAGFVPLDGSIAARPGRLVVGRRPI